MFEHQHSICCRDRDCATGAAFARMTAILGTPSDEACFRRTGDGLGLTAFFGAYAGISPCRIDQRNNRNAEAVGHFHQAHGLSIAFRPRHSKIMLESAFSVRAFFVADDAHAFAAETAEAADDCGVVAELAITGKWDEVGNQPCDVIKTVWPLRVSGNLRLLPRRRSA